LRVGISACHRHGASQSIDHTVNDLIDVFYRKLALRRFILVSVLGLIIVRLLGVFIFVSSSYESVGLRILFDVAFKLGGLDEVVQRFSRIGGALKKTD
jgi:hypothetical protein